MVRITLSAKVSEKGQIVIPQKIRKELNIDASVPLHIVQRGKGVYIYPIREIITETGHETPYLKVLEKTRGAWKKSKKANEQKKRALELTASKKRKEVW